MPDVDGIELLRHVRSDEALNTMPVVSEFSNACHNFADWLHFWSPEGPKICVLQ